MARPIVCKPPPPPPPPPPPGDPWPPDNFFLTLEHTFESETGPQTDEWTVEMIYEEDDGWWFGVHAETETGDHTFSFTVGSGSAELLIIGWCDVWGDFTLHAIAIPITEPGPNIYIITAWEALEWWMTSAKASFTF